MKRKGKATFRAFGDIDPAAGSLHRRLGIKPYVHRQAILNDVAERGNGRPGLSWSFDPEERVGPSHHRYRVNVTLAKVV